MDRVDGPPPKVHMTQVKSEDWFGLKMKIFNKLAKKGICTKLQSDEGAKFFRTKELKHLGLNDINKLDKQIRRNIVEIKCFSEGNPKKLLIDALKSHNTGVASDIMRTLGFDDPQNPIHSAAKQGSPDMIKLLIEVGVDPMQPDQDGKSALHVASNKDVARLLIEENANALATDNRGNTPIFYVDQDVALLLLYDMFEQNRAGKGEFLVTAVLDENGNTPMHYAAKLGDIDLFIRMLRVEDTHLKSQNNKGETPLHLALTNNVLLNILDNLEIRPKIFAALNIKDKNGNTVHSLANETLKAGLREAT